MDAASTWTVAVAVALLGLTVASLSSRVNRLPVSEPLLALLLGVAIGPHGTGWVRLPALGEPSELLHHVADVLLVVSVTAVGLRYPYAAARSRRTPVALLLVVVMPTMAAATALVGWGALGLGLGAALLLGTALCPTDPVLASSVVTGDLAECDVAARTRQVLSLESGANDGLALPLVVVAIAVAGPLAGGDAAIEVARSVLGAVVLGVGAGLASAAAIRAGERHGETQQAPVLVFSLVLAVGVLGAAELLGVGGVLAAFLAALTLNRRWRGQDRLAAASYDEALNRYAVLPVFVLLGAALPWAAWGELGVLPVVAVVVGVLLLRRLPWLLLLRRPLGLAWRDAAFLGWFGPVGVSALFYLTEISSRVPGSRDVVAAGAAVLAASTVAHGVTSTVGRRLYVAAG